MEKKRKPRSQKMSAFGKALRQQIADANVAFALRGGRYRFTYKELAIRINTSVKMIPRLLYYGSLPSNQRLISIAEALWGEEGEDRIIQCLEVLLHALGHDRGGFSIDFDLGVQRQELAIGPMARDLAIELNEQRKEKS